MANMSIGSLVDRIFDHLRGHSSVIPSRRRRGVSPEALELLERDLDLQLPADVRELYLYCDGTSTSTDDLIGEIYFFPGYYWWSLEEALYDRKLLVEFVEQRGGEEVEWDKAWIPIFTDGGGDYYCVICDSSSPHFGEILYFFPEKSRPLTVFRNLATMLEILERAFAEEAFFMSEGFLTVDDAKMRALARDVQPDFVEHEL